MRPAGRRSPAAPASTPVARTRRIRPPLPPPRARVVRYRQPMPRAAKPTRLPGGGLSMATEPDYFVKQGDFQFLAAGRPMLYYREPAKALADWERGWRDLFLGTFPAS